MNEAAQDPTPLLHRGGGRGLRFRDLRHRLFSMAHQGFLRLDFLQMACGSVLEFLACDVIEVRLEEAGKEYRCRGTTGKGVSRFICDAPLQEPLPRPPAADPEGPSLTDQIMDSVLLGQCLAAAPFSTRGGSFWTGDASRPVLLRESGRQDGPPRSLVIGGEYLSLAFVPVPVDERVRGILLLGSRKPDCFTREDLQTFETVGETLGVAVAFQASQWALRERVKELDCLYGIAQLSQRPGLALDDQLREIVELLPPAWQYPELTAACITLDGRAFATAAFEPTPWLQSAGLRVAGALRGSVQVAYLREMPAFGEGPFLLEERSLIDEVAHQVALLVGRWEDQKAKAKLFHMLEQRRE